MQRKAQDWDVSFLRGANSKKFPIFFICTNAIKFFKIKNGKCCSCFAKKIFPNGKTKMCVHLVMCIRLLFYYYFSPSIRALSNNAKKKKKKQTFLLLFLASLFMCI